VPWRLRRLGRSTVRSASLVKVLSDDKMHVQSLLLVDPAGEVELAGQSTQVQSEFE